jgi:hypothetical protein
MSKTTSWCMSLLLSAISGAAIAMFMGGHWQPSAMAQEATSKTVRAEAFELVDHNNKLRGVVKIGAGDAPSFQLFDANGVARIRIEVAADGSALMAVNGPKGKTRASIWTPASGPGGIAIDDEKGGRCAMFAC